MKAVLSTMQRVVDTIHPVPAVVPQAARTTNVAIQSAIIDTLGYDGCTFLIMNGVNTDADVTFAVTMEHGNDAALADTSAPSASEIDGTLALAGATFADDSECRKVGYLGSKRYVRLTITPSLNDAGNIFIVVIALLTNPLTVPTPNPPQ